jgi:predicted ABC-type ATPase
VTKPRLTIIAGANGSGKTTFTSDIKFFHEIPLLDPDAIGKTLQATMPQGFPVASARHVLTAAGEHIARGESFAVETTLSGKSYLRMMLDARKRSFEIVLVYIGTENVETNLARIKNRVLAGGHNVPEPDVRRRYKRSFANLPTAIERADHPILFDNSTEEGYRLVAVLGASGDRWFKPIPDWAGAFHR